jgi:hypothetical protein
MSTKPIPTAFRPGAPTLPQFPEQAIELDRILPPPDTKRWVIRRKAAVVEAVRNGLLSLEQACERYKLSTEELFTWQKLVDSHGLPGLRVTRLQTYRGGNLRR